MAIYGTALLSVCLLVGLIVGDLLGLVIGVNANVGGVGFAMLLLILTSDRLRLSGHLTRPDERGILFWSSIDIPIVVAWMFGYRDAVSMTTIGGGAATYIVGPVTGDALGASSDVKALSIAVGLIKSILVMTTTPFVAKRIGLNNPRSALIFGGLMGTTSGVAGGLAATDPKLVPCGAMTATFYTGLGCLLGPSVCFFVIRAVV